MRKLAESVGKAGRVDGTEGLSEPPAFPEAARQLYECMRQHGDAAYSVPDWAILARLSIVDARRAAHWLASMPDQRHPYIRRQRRAFKDEDTYSVAGCSE